MEKFGIQLLTLLTLLHQTASDSNTTELIGAVGRSVTFHSHSTDTQPALWTFENIPIVTVEFKDPPQSFFYQPKFQTRFTVSEDGRALSISQLRMEDAGTYSVTINGKKSTFNLQVYKELTEPTVTCESLNCSDGRCLVSLRCSVPGAGFGNISYTWRDRGYLQDDGSVVVVVNKSSQDQLELLRCTAQNAVSSRNVTVTTPGGLCPDTASASGVGIGIGVIVMVLLLVFLGLICKFKGWKKFCHSQSNTTDTVTTAKYTTVYAEVGPSQQHIPNGINGEPMGGESSSTVHSLVKHPEQVENVTITGLEGAGAGLKDSRIGLKF